VGDPVKDVYMAIDRGMGRILEGLEDETTVIFLAGHGMGPKYQAQFLLDSILLRLGVAAPMPPEPAPAAERPIRLRDRIDPLLASGWRHLPQSVRKKLKNWHRRTRRWIDGPPERVKATINPATSRCFMVSNNFAHGGIRINLVGREPQGTVQPGAECDALCEEVARDLLDIVNLDTGRPVVQRVLRTAEFYEGPYLDHLPDLLVIWRNDAPVYRIGSTKIGEITGKYDYCRSGEHKPGGLFIACGPAVPHGRLTRPVSILDFAPTLSAMLGVDLPDTDGKTIRELVAGTASAALPVAAGA
jgi:predicted AlkP superfamily phosphohydrolase/phosphomutase